MTSSTSSLTETPSLVAEDYLAFLKLLYQPSTLPVLPMLRDDFSRFLKLGKVDTKRMIDQLKRLPSTFKTRTLNAIIADIEKDGKTLKKAKQEYDIQHRKGEFDSDVDNISSASHYEEKKCDPIPMQTGVSLGERKLIKGSISAPVDSTSILNEDPVDALNQRGAFFYKEKKYAEALPYFEQAITLAELTRRSSGEISALKRRQAFALNGVGGILLFKEKNYIDAISCLTRATNIAIKIQAPAKNIHDFERARVYALRTLGAVLETSGQYADAIACYEKIKEIPLEALLPENQISTAEQDQARALSKLNAILAAEGKHEKKSSSSTSTSTSAPLFSPKKEPSVAKKDALARPSSTR